MQTWGGCSEVSAPVDLSGRFNFWHVLILCRAITPPWAVRGLWPKLVNSERAGWWLLLFVAGVAAGGAATSASVIRRLSPRRSIRLRSVHRQAMCRLVLVGDTQSARPTARCSPADHGCTQPGVGGLEKATPSKSARPDMDKTKRAALRETGIDKDLSKRARLVVRWFCRRARSTSDARQCPWQH